MAKGRPPDQFSLGKNEFVGEV
jgi:hypothetical protein